MSDARAYLDSEGIQEKLTAIVSQVIAERPANLMERIGELCLEKAASELKLPPALDIFYKQLLSNPSNPKAAELAKEAFHDDWNTRPNPLDPCGGGTLGENWPGGAAVPMVLGLWGTQLQPCTFAPMLHLDCGEGRQLMISTFSGTCTGKTLDGFPHFLGLEPEQLTGKSFSTIAIDVQVLVEGKIKQSYHCENFADISDQILGSMGRKGPTTLDHGKTFLGERGAKLTEVPACIPVFYEDMLSNCLNPKGAELAKQCFHDDWNTRPNPLDPEGGGKLGENWPGGAAPPMVLGLWGTQIEGLKFDRKMTMLNGDKVVVVSTVTGKCTGETVEGMPHFLNLEPDVLRGKSFQCIAIDVHKIVDGKIKQSYHLEDWADAKTQIVSGRGPPVLSF